MKARGFTLVELLVVLMVLAVGTAVVAPSVGRATDGIRARAEVSKFTAFLRYARQQAVTRRQAHEVRIDPETRLLVLTAGGRPATSRRLGERLRIEATPASALTLRFMPEGLSTGGTFRIEASGARPFVITVDPLTGRVGERRDDA